jgi:serine phosphatase RsbU (regulator of sigma subunit)
MRAIFWTHPEVHGDPGTTLTAVGRLFHAVTRPELFMTGLYLVLGEGGQVTWASAGHDPPLHIRPSGQVAPAGLAPVGFPLGTDADEVYETVSWKLAPGDRLLLFTDGLVEARGEDGEGFGRLRLRRLLTGLAHLSLPGMVREVVAQAAGSREGAVWEDDFTVLGVELRS